MFSLSLDMVVEFLRCFPCLEKLCIEVCCFFFIGSSFRLAALSSTYLVLKCCFFAYLCSFQSSVPGRKNKYWEPEHPNLIRCLDANLKTVLMRSYMGNDCDIDFVNFFALNARVLKSMIVVVKTNNKKFLASQHEKLQLDNRTFRVAQFRFTTENSRRNYWHIAGVHDLYLVDP